MTNCTQCNNPVQADQAFCGVCGAPVAPAAPGPASPPGWGPPGGPAGPAEGGIRSTMGGAPTPAPPSQSGWPPAGGQPGPAGPADAAPPPPPGFASYGTTPPYASPPPASPSGGSGIPPTVADPGGWGGGADGPVPAPAPTGGSSKRPLIVIGGIVAVVIVIAGLVFVMRGDDSGGGGSATLDIGGIRLEVGTAPSGEPKKAWDASADCALEEDYGDARRAQESSGGSCDLAVGGDTVLLSQVEDGDGEIRAFSTSDGKELWKQTGLGSGDLYGASVNVVGDVALVSTSSDKGSETTVYSLGDGTERWDRDGSYTGVSDGTVVILSDDSSDDSSEAAVVDLGSGEDRWTKEGYPVGLCSGTVYLRNEGDELVARSLDSGDEKWNENLGSDDEYFSGFACGTDGVFVSADGDVRSLDPGSGDEKWKESVSDGSVRQVIDGLVFVVDGSETTALSASDGKKVWDVDDDDWSPFYVMTTNGGTALALGDGGVALIDLETGDDSESRSTGDNDGAIGANALVELDDDRAEAYSTDTLKSMWSVDVGDDVVALDVGDGGLYVVSTEKITGYR